MAAWLEGLIAVLTKASNEDAGTRRFKSEAASALADGDLEGAVSRLKTVRRTIREGRRRIEERLREDILLLNQQMAGEANVIARQAEMELTRRDYAAAAELFAEARDSLPASEVQASWLYAMRQGEALFRLGDEFDDAQALAESVRAYGASLAMTGREEAPRNWVAAQCGIALAHLRIGERQLDAGALRTSIEAWRAALAMLEPLDEPAQKLVSQRHLARALALLGERESATDALAEAVQLYRALTVAIPRAISSFDWAEAQMGLASTLLTLDERTEPASEMPALPAALTDAVTALDAALTVYTRAAHPSEWSTARMNMGNALLSLGEQGPRDQSLARYGDAVVCFEDALAVQLRDTAPGNWALIQTNRANALAAIGELARDPAHLEAAATAYRQALDVLTAPEDAMRRAIAGLNLGTVLVRLAETREPRRHWMEAMAVMLSALETFKARKADAFVRIAEVNLRNLHRASNGAVSNTDAVHAMPQAKAG